MFQVPYLRRTAASGLNRIMRLLSVDKDGKYILTRFHDRIPPYAILSHRWSDDEPTFQDLVNHEAEYHEGSTKLQFCTGQAAKDGLQYFWVDTVCIDKQSSAELTESIISMLHWYKHAAKCYVFLQDVHSNYQGSQLYDQFWRSSWFTRGWTLQELIAPAEVQFFDAEGRFIGDKRTLEFQISTITGVPPEVLRGADLSKYSVKERFSWCNNRITTRIEDRAYCMFGIFDVAIPVLYGEREKAFHRLQAEITETAAHASSRMHSLSTDSDSKSSQAPEATQGQRARSDVTRAVQQGQSNCSQSLHMTPTEYTEYKDLYCTTCRFTKSNVSIFQGIRLKDGKVIPGETIARLCHYLPESYRSFTTRSVKAKHSFFRCHVCQEVGGFRDICYHLVISHTLEQVGD